MRQAQKLLGILSKEMQRIERLSNYEREKQALIEIACEIMALNQQTAVTPDELDGCKRKMLDEVARLYDRYEREGVFFE
jgi:hypothetical protein